MTEEATEIPLPEIGHNYHDYDKRVFFVQEVDLQDPADRHVRGLVNGKPFSTTYNQWIDVWLLRKPPHPFDKQRIG